MTPAPSWRAPSLRPLWRKLGRLVDPSRAFLATYAPEGIEEMEAGVPLMSEEVGEDAVLTEADRVYPPAVELLLDPRPE